MSIQMETRKGEGKLSKMEDRLKSMESDVQWLKDSVGTMKKKIEKLLKLYGYDLEFSSVDEKIQVKVEEEKEIIIDKETIEKGDNEEVPSGLEKTHIDSISSLGSANENDCLSEGRSEKTKSMDDVLEVTKGPLLSNLHLSTRYRPTFSQWVNIGRRITIGGMNQQVEQNIKENIGLSGFGDLVGRKREGQKGPDAARLITTLSIRSKKERWKRRKKRKKESLVEEKRKQKPTPHPEQTEALKFLKLYVQSIVIGPKTLGRRLTSLGRYPMIHEIQYAKRPVDRTPLDSRSSLSIQKIESRLSFNRASNIDPTSIAVRSALNSNLPSYFSKVVNRCTQRTLKNQWKRMAMKKAGEFRWMFYCWGSPTVKAGINFCGDINSSGVSLDSVFYPCLSQILKTSCPYSDLNVFSSGSGWSMVEEQVPSSYQVSIDDFNSLIDHGWNNHFDPSLLQPLSRAASTIDVDSSHSETLHLVLVHAPKQFGPSVPIDTTESAFRLGLLTMYDHYPSCKSVLEFDWFTPKGIDIVFQNVIQLTYSQNYHFSGKKEGVVITLQVVGHLLGGTVWKVTKDGGNVLYDVDFNQHHEENLDGTILESFVPPMVLITYEYRTLSNQPSRSPKGPEFVEAIPCNRRANENLLPLGDAVAAVGRVLEMFLIVEQLTRLISTSGLENVLKGPKIVPAPMTSLEEGLSHDIIVDGAADLGDLVPFTKRAQFLIRARRLQSNPSPTATKVNLSKRVLLVGKGLAAYEHGEEHLKQKKALKATLVHEEETKAVVGIDIGLADPMIIDGQAHVDVAGLQGGLILDGFPGDGGIGFKVVEEALKRIENDYVHKATKAAEFGPVQEVVLAIAMFYLRGLASHGVFFEKSTNVEKFLNKAGVQENREVISGKLQDNQEEYDGDPEEGDEDLLMQCVLKFQLKNSFSVADYLGNSFHFYPP